MRRFLVASAWAFGSGLALMALTSALWASVERIGVHETSALIAEVIVWLVQVFLVVAVIVCFIRLAGRGHWLNGGSNNA